MIEKDIVEMCDREEVISETEREREKTNAEPGPWRTLRHFQDGRTSGSENYFRFHPLHS